MRYRWRPWQELGWSVAVAGATVLLIELVGLHPEAITDLQSWGVALGAGMVRAMAGAALDWLRRQMTEGRFADDLADRVREMTPSQQVRLRELVAAAEANP